jgi:hypothetical protein
MSAPPLSTFNRYHVLSVDTLDEEISRPEPVQAAQPSLPKVRRRKWEKRLPAKYVIAATANSLTLSVDIETTESMLRRKVKALLDCGATGLFLDTDYVCKNAIPTRLLSRPIPVFNVDGTPNEAGEIREVVTVVLQYGEHKERATFAVTKLGNQDMILGYSWLDKHNPEVDWRTKEVLMTRCPSECDSCRKKAKEEKKTSKREAERIQTCRSGGFPAFVEDVEDEDDPWTKPQKPEAGSGFDEAFVCETRADLTDLPSLVEIEDGEEEDVREARIEEGDRIFVATLYPEASPADVRATSTVSQRLAEAFAKNSEAKSFRDVVPESLFEFEDVFSKEAFDSLPERRKWDHAIELEREDELPSTRKVYPMSPEEQKELDDFLEEALASGRVRPSKSPVGAPVFFIKKKDGRLRFVQDYRALNAITRKNRYPLPLIDDLIQRLSGAKYFTKLDVRWGYNNVRIKEGDEWKAAFRTTRGLFEPLVMYFGLTNSPGTFQTMMNEIFSDLIIEGVVAVYLDDILIFTNSLEEHRRITQIVMQRMRENKLYLRHDKCEFEKTRIEYLGVIISHNHVEMDPVKVSGVAEWPVPTNKKEVQSFLGFVNFYRRFIADFSHHARPLFDLTKKDTPFVWSDEAKGAFADLKKIVISTPVLILPQADRPFRIEADGSGVATGAVLSQVSPDDEKWHPVAFLSKSLSAVERNYEIHDVEMLAIVRALEQWRHFLEGAQHPAEIWTDHKNLEYFRTAQKLNRRQARWSLYLSRFDFTLHHKPGKSMGKPDALSRRVDHGTGHDDNRDVTLLSPDLFRIHALSAMDIVGEERDILRDIRRSLRDDDQEEAVVKAAEKLRQDRTRGTVRSAEWSMANGLMMFRGKVYVPKDRDLRRRIVEQHHDSRVAGHPGRWKTLELVSRNYWWPQMSRYIGTYVRTCDPCIRTKIQRQKPYGELHPLETPEERWDKISVDFVTELPDSHGYDAIMNVVDSVGKLAHFLPTHTTITAVGAANLYFRDVWKHHGLPRSVLSDRGSQFVAEFTRELYRLLGIKLATSSAYHPQTDGQTERSNQELEQYLRLFVSERQDDWDELLPLAEFSYNNHVHSSTQQTPFMLDSGRHPRMGFEPQQPRSHVESVNEFKDRMGKGLEEAKAALTKAKDEYAQYYNRRRTPAPEYKTGDMVFLDASDIKTTRPSKKLAHRRLGPYMVEEKVGHSYRLRLPPTLHRLWPVFPVTKLTPAPPDPIPGRRRDEPPPPILMDGQEEYEVEDILDSRLRYRRLEYLVKWRGYDTGQNSWIPRSDVFAPEIVTNFHRQHPGAPRQISAAFFDTISFSRADLDSNWRDHYGS